MKTVLCPACMAEAPENASLCAACGARIRTGAPDFAKVGMGAVGNVHVEHKPVGSIHQETHYHQHGPPASSHPWHRGLVILAALGAGLSAVVLSRQPMVVNIHPEQALAPATSGPDAPVPSPQITKESLSGPPGTIPLSPACPEIRFDRENRTYHDGEALTVRLTAPSAGHLYAALLWADGRATLLHHPDTSPAARPGTEVLIRVNLEFSPEKAEDTQSREQIAVLLSPRKLTQIPADTRRNIGDIWRSIIQDDAMMSSSDIRHFQSDYLLKKRP